MVAVTVTVIKVYASYETVLVTTGGVTVKVETWSSV